MREVAERAILENIKKRLLSDDAIRYIMEQVETAIRRTRGFASLTLVRYAFFR